MLRYSRLVNRKGGRGNAGAPNGVVSWLRTALTSMTGDSAASDVHVTDRASRSQRVRGPRRERGLRGVDVALRDQRPPRSTPAPVRARLVALSHLPSRKVPMITCSGRLITRLSGDQASPCHALLVAFVGTADGPQASTRGVSWCLRGRTRSSVTPPS